MDLLAMMIRSSCVLCWLSPLLQGIISKQAKQRLDRRDSEQVLCVYRSASTRVCGSTVLCGAAVLPLRTTYEPNNTKKTCHGTYSVSTLKERERKREDNKLKMKQDTTMLSWRTTSPERARLLFAGTISCPAGGPTDGRHKKIRQEEDF